MLSNPVSIAGFAFASYMFFKERIPQEEVLLVEFFGQAYIDYAMKTPILIPGVQGAIHEVDEDDLNNGKKGK